MKKVFFILTMLCLLPSISFAADNFKRCSVASKPQINFYTSYGKLVYDFSKSKEEISKIAGFSVLGLAERKTGVAYQIDSIAAPYGKGYCVAPKKINIYIGVQYPKIHVTNSYKEGTCLHNFVLRHEQAHMQVTVRMLEQFVSVAVERLFRASRQFKPILVSNQSEANSASQIVNDTYREMIIKMVTILNEEIEKEQANIDNKELNALILEVCKEDYLRDYFGKDYKEKPTM